jgi:signal transduction histidine kinase
MDLFRKSNSDNFLKADLNVVRELIFGRLLLAYAILGFIAYVPSVLLAVIHELWLIVITDTLGYSIIILFILKKTIRTELKVIITLLISLGIGIVLLFEVGPFGAGYFWIFAVPLIAAVLLQFRYSIIALGINIFLFIIVGILQYNGFLKWNEMYDFNLANWVILSVNFILLNIGTTLSLAVLIKRLEKSLEREKRYANKLVEERNDLIKANEAAERANRLKTEFLAQMSHEIRTPVNTIMSYLSLVKESLIGTQDESITDSFKMIELGSMRLMRTIDSILNMSELQAGSYETNFIEKNVCRDILEPLFVEFKLYATNKSLDFNLNLNCDNYIYKGDVYTLTQLFANLIDNAIKYTNHGHVTISSSNDKNGHFYVSVSDSGIGMSEEYIERMFEPFSQEEQGYTRKFEGTGLGLSLVQKYAEINNLSVDIKSKKNEGTIFIVFFNNKGNTN